MAGVEDHIYANAGELLDALSPRYEPLWSNNPGAWIVRGQGDAKWQLQPAAVRDLSLFIKFGIAAHDVRTGSPAWSVRAKLIKEMLTQFRDGLDKSGVPIPSPSPRIEAENRYSSSAEPEPEAFPLMAFAQHHGLPTLLLDWTRRAWVAAYFAAVQAVEECSRWPVAELRRVGTLPRGLVPGRRRPVRLRGTRRNEPEPTGPVRAVHSDVSSR